LGFLGRGRKGGEDKISERAFANSCGKGRFTVFVKLSDPWRRTELDESLFFVIIAQRHAAMHVCIERERNFLEPNEFKKVLDMSKVFETE
jgi:hypothetical protein